MATAYITMGKVGGTSQATRIHAYAGQPASETVTTSGTAASGALVATEGDIAQVFCATGVYARQGGTASAATGIFCPPGIPQYIAMVPGNTLSLIDA